MASWLAPRFARSWPAGSWSAAAMPSRICSVETYSSFRRSASSNARSRTPLVARLNDCCETSETLGSRSICFSASPARAVGETPSFSRSGGTTPSPCAINAQRRCSGSTCCWPERPAISCAAWSASWAFTVSLSNRSIAGFSHFACTDSKASRTDERRDTKKGRQDIPPAPGPTDLVATIRDADLHLLGLRLGALRQFHRQHTVLVFGLDGFTVHAVRQTEAAAERAVGAFDAKVIILLHLFLELPLAANREHIVFDANVEVLLVDIWQIGLQHQFVLGLVNIDRRRPSG